MPVVPDGYSLFVVDLHHVVPLEQVDAAISGHVEFLKRNYASGTFLASGRKVPRRSRGSPTCMPRRPGHRRMAVLGAARLAAPALQSDDRRPGSGGALRYPCARRTDMGPGLLAQACHPERRRNGDGGYSRNHRNLPLASWMPRKGIWSLSNSAASEAPAVSCDVSVWPIAFATITVGARVSYGLFG